MNGQPATVFLLVLLSALVVVGQQPRDNVRPKAAGTASLQGSVTAKDIDAQPLRRARVTITGIDVDYDDTAITTDDGSFGFTGLPAGSYTLRASKDPFIPTAAGARRPGSAGVPITLTAGQPRRVNIQLPRGGVITGRIHTPEGDPASGVVVTALGNRFVPSVGGRRLTTVGSPALTDDRGQYRIYGLPPGEYVVSVRSTRGSAAGLQVLTDAEIRDALSQLHRTLWSPGRPGPTAPPPRPITPTAPPRPTLGHAPVFYPGTTFLERASLVALAEGQVRTAVDFDLEYVSLASIEGAISVPQSAERVQVTLARASVQASDVAEMLRYATPDIDGRFAFRSLPPGQYRIFARAGTALAGAADVTLTGEDIAGLTITLQPALSISGRLVFDPPLDALPVLPAMPMIPLVATNMAGANLTPRAAITGDTFVLSGLMPARYRLDSIPRGLRTPIGRWWLKSATVGGREILDEPIDLQASATDAVLAWSDRASELSGSVRDASGAAARGTWLVVFSREPRSWFFNSRRVAGLRADAEGRYVIRNLPAGDYLAIATSEIEANEWFDPETLRALLPDATPLSIRGDESHTLDLIVRR